MLWGPPEPEAWNPLYWLGVKLISGRIAYPGMEVILSSGRMKTCPDHITLEQSLKALIDYCKVNKLDQLHFSTSLMIVPGYSFRTITGLITNFHLPGSTLLLLIAALIGEDWRKVYEYALDQQLPFSELWGQFPAASGTKA